MAITGASLLQTNGGEIENDFFPSETLAQLTDRLNRYVVEGYSKAPTLDAAVKAWAYYRTYMAIYLRMSAQPTNTELVDQSRVGWDKEQALRFYDLAQEKLAEFDALIDKKPEKIFHSGHTRNVYRW